MTDDPQDHNHRKDWVIKAKGEVHMKPGDSWLPANFASGPIDLPGWEALERFEDKQAVRLLAKYNAPEGFICPECGVVGDYILFGTRKFEYVDIPHGKQFHIIALRQRRRCNACGATRFQALPDMHPKHMMTLRLVEYIRLEAFESTFTEIAQKIGITETTIRRVFGEYVKELEAEHERYTPEYMGIDELKINKAWRGVITDVQNRRPIEFLRARQEPTLVRFLNTMDKAKIRVVTMDMSGSYRPLVMRVLPHARIVIDKFHVLQMANKAMERVRRATHAQLSDTARKQLKTDRRILLLRRGQLAQAEEFLLDSWIERFEDLGTAYKVKEAFCEIWNSPYRARAESLYYQWVDEMPPEMEPFYGGMIETIERWREEVFSYFDTGMTNAYTEAVNSILRAANRRGNGYSFEVLRAKLLFNPKRKRPKPEPAIWDNDEDRQFDFYIDYLADDDGGDDDKQP